MKKLLVAANSPGEVAWLRPFSEEVRSRGWRCDVLLYPCTFASGREAEVLATYPGVDRVWQGRELWRLGLKEGRCYPPGTPLLHLGGDLLYSALGHWRWGWDCWSYLWARPWWDRAFRGYFSRNADSTRGLLRRRVRPQKIFEVGDLIVDSVLAQVPRLPERNPRLISFFPGSRQREVCHLVPFYARVADELAERFPDLEFQLPISPFLSFKALALELQGPPDPRLDGVPVRLEEGAVVTPRGTRLRWLQEETLEAVARSILAVSIPGTKTAEAGSLGVPTLTLLPLNCPEHLPYGGLLGLLDWVPGGARWKGRWLTRKAARLGLLSQPNQLLGKAVMPEMIDHLTAPKVAAAVAQLLQDPEELRVRGNLVREAYGSLRGASQRICDSIGLA